jgi:hypothetical protein
MKLDLWTGFRPVCSGNGGQRTRAAHLFERCSADYSGALPGSGYATETPMSFGNYKEVRPWAKAIKEAIALKKMPPWFADPQVGHFKNDTSLSKAEADTIIAWVDAGAPEGDPKDALAPKQYVTGWNIGQPEMVLEMPQAFDVPASGTVEYQCSHPALQVRGGSLGPGL